MKIYWMLVLGMASLHFLGAQSAPYNQQLKLIPDQAEEGDFGSAVDIEGDWIMVGAEDGSFNGLNAGTVYVYNKNSGTPTFVKTIVSSDASGLNRFGKALSIENSTMVVGAWAKSAISGGSSVPGAGKAYIFEKDEGGTNNWGEVKSIQAPMPSATEYYGFSVDISENVIAISGHRNNDLASIAGKVYLYGRNVGGLNNWGFIKGVTQVGGAADYQFGRWVEVSEDYLFVTSYDVNNQGKVHLYYKNEGGINNWGHKKTFASDDPATNRFYGDETSLSGNEILIGALRDINSNGSNTGKVFLHRKDEGGVDNWGLVKTFEPSTTEFEFPLFLYNSNTTCTGLNPISY